MSKNMKLMIVTSNSSDYANLKFQGLAALHPWRDLVYSCFPLNMVFSEVHVHFSHISGRRN